MLSRGHGNALSRDTRARDGWQGSRRGGGSVGGRSSERHLARGTAVRCRVVDLARDTTATRCRGRAGIRAHGRRRRAIGAPVRSRVAGAVRRRADSCGLVAGLTGSALGVPGALHHQCGAGRSAAACHGDDVRAERQAAAGQASTQVPSAPTVTVHTVIPFTATVTVWPGTPVPAMGGKSCCVSSRFRQRAAR